ncbi:iron ABC transporter permease [soil metagenome]
MAVNASIEESTNGDDLLAMTRDSRHGWLFLVMIGSLVGAILLNVGIGAVRINPERVIGILASHAGFDLGIDFTRQQNAVLWSIRLPRVVLTGLVGAALAVSGAALQGVFRNPLADPGLIGVSSGAALGAVASIVLALSPFGSWSLSIFAFIGGLLTTMIVYVLARRGGRTDVVTLILTGIALNAIAGAGTSFFIYLADDAQLRTITFWTMGSTGGATWKAVSIYLPFAAIGLLLIPRFGSALNLLVLGEYEARHLGVNTERTRVVLILLTATLAGASVAIAGTIGFIGLIVPHLIRLLVGPDHRILIPASAFGGATLLLLADLFARTIVSPSELPLGTVTALLGGPFFLWMLHRTMRQQGSWNQ